MPVNGSVKWISGKIYNDACGYDYFEKFQFKDVTASVGNFVLVASSDPSCLESTGGYDVAQILALYENPENRRDPYRAKVRWYSRPCDLPAWCLLNSKDITFHKNEVIEDHRPFDNDVSIETFRKNCHVVKTYTNTTLEQLMEESPGFQFVCRYRLKTVSKRKGQLEPVLEEERKLLSVDTPKKKYTESSLSRFSSTPESLTKRISRVALSDDKNWSVSKNEGTKLLLKKAILKEHNGKYSPKTTKRIVDSPKKGNRLSGPGIRHVLMELKENSEDELPTLIIKNAIPEDRIRVSIESSASSEIENTPRRSNRVSRNPVKYIESPVETPEKWVQKRSHTENSDEEFSSASSEIENTPRRSNRVSKNPLKYIESPVKTPEKSVRKRTHTQNSDDEFSPPKTPRTPKAVRTPRTPRSSSSVSRFTGSARRRLTTSLLTPTLQKRAHPVQKNGLIKDNNSLPGREKEMDTVLFFIKTRLLEGTSGCLYISGVPGTGKTATVCSALLQLQAEPGLPEFQLVHVNGMKIPNPRQAYVEIYKQLTGKCVSWKQACILLEKMFTKTKGRKIPTVLLVDELDALCTRKQDVLYDIMEWARHDSARLTVLAVANAMDLPDTALPARVASRVGLTRLTFQPYTHVELKTIVTTKLTGAANVSADALELIARKVAAISGDARRALELCTRTLDLASGSAGLQDVSRALAEATCSATIRAVKSKSPAEKLMLRAIASEVDRTGSEETTLSRALSAAAAIVSLDGRPYKAAVSVRAPTWAQALVICQRLAVSRLVLMKPRPGDPKIVLNVSSDDVHYATKQISVRDV